MKELEKEFVPYQESLELKNLDFNEPCLSFREKDNDELFTFHSDSYQKVTGFFCLENQINAPTFSQAFRFFRKKYNLRHNITDFVNNENKIEWDYEIAEIGTDVDENGNYKPLIDYSTNDETRQFKSYEEAELACLRKLIEIVEARKIVPFQESLKLKLLGFDKHTRHRYFIANVEDNPIPGLQKNCFPRNYNNYDDSSTTYYSAPLFSQAFEWFREKGFVVFYKNEEVAELTCLRKLIEIF